jgi:hypothetical protein
VNALLRIVYYENAKKLPADKVTGSSSICVFLLERVKIIATKTSEIKLFVAHFQLRTSPIVLQLVCSLNFAELILLTNRISNLNKLFACYKLT